ncbi:MAG: hypothetical protein V1874_16900 [Spirochaetota bacterium]
MQKKNLLCFAIFAAAIILTGCASAFSIVKENPSSPKLSGYQSIYIGWLDLREDDWKLYGYDSKNTWATEIKRHNINGLQEYIKLELPGKTIIGSTAKSDAYLGKGDLFLKFKYNKINQNYNGWGAVDELLVDVDFIEGKTGKTLYTASIVTTQAAAFPRNWKGATFDGRVDNEIYNLSWGIAEKLK